MEDFDLMYWEYKNESEAILRGYKKAYIARVSYSTVSYHPGLEYRVSITDPDTCKIVADANGNILDSFINQLTIRQAVHAAFNTPIE